MRLPFSTMGAVEDFFLFRAFKPAFFSLLERAE